jgi:hypothetical protein
MWMSDSEALLHHAVRFHFDRLQIDGGDFHAGALLRDTDRVFEGQRRSGQCGGQGQCG